MTLLDRLRALLPRSERDLTTYEPGSDEQLQRAAERAARRYDEPGSDEQFRRLGLWERVLARRDEDRERERLEELRTIARARDRRG